MKTFTIQGVELPKGINEGGVVPPINEAYLFDDSVKDICLDILENRRVMLTGECGTGKSSLVEQIAARIGQGIIRIGMNGQSSPSDFVGYHLVKGGNMEYIYGALPWAMKMGLWLLIDEIDFTEPHTLAVLNPVLEKNGVLFLKEKDREMIVPHPNFRIFGTANTIGTMQRRRGAYQGTNIMNEAFLDRWRAYHRVYLKPEEEIGILMKTVPRIKENIAKKVVEIASALRDAFAKEEIQTTFSLRKMIDWCELMIRHKDPYTSAKIAIYSKVSQEDAVIIHGIIKRIVGDEKNK